jgi:hypothetical protein
MSGTGEFDDYIAYLREKARLAYRTPARQAPKREAPIRDFNARDVALYEKAEEQQELTRLAACRT